MFTSKVINQYYRITFENVHLLPTIQDMGEVVQFLYGQDDAWPLPGKDFEHNKLKVSLLILNLFVSHNIDPSTHRTTINDARARFLYHLARGRKIDLESYIYTWISTLGFQTDKRHTAIFSTLISGICKEVGVQISTAELVMKSRRPINRCALENTRRHTAQGIVPTTEEQPQEEQSVVPQPATPLADMASML
ncbi:Uncharacterized protein Adt_39809 [Abeliophyllum distichum]|uniref:Putative plant transposon protein domain-containing protein n=1 Tax=Abeliophyllum distichum TaxID=126358 RepID=A0ABD1Q651_9LAMI